MLHQFQCQKEGSLFYYQHGFGNPSNIIEFCPVCGHDEVRATGRTFPDVEENSPLPHAEPDDTESDEDEDGNA